MDTQVLTLEMDGTVANVIEMLIADKAHSYTAMVQAHDEPNQPFYFRGINLEQFRDLVKSWDCGDYHARVVPIPYMVSVPGQIAKYQYLFTANLGVGGCTVVLATLLRN